MRPRIYYVPRHNSFNAYYLEKFIFKYLDLVPYDRDEDPLDSCILINQFDDPSQISVAHLDRCRCVLIDNLQECDINNINHLRPYRDKLLFMTTGVHQDHEWLKILNIPEWFWYFESLWYRDREYHLYQPKRENRDRLFFMPMRRSSPGRKMIYTALEDMLPNAIWSFVEKGTELPGIPKEYREDQRWFEPSWYDRTFFSVVNEDSDDRRPLIWTEKTCKPLAFYHPFVVIAQRGLLSLIRSYGFETFPEIWDESYDDLPDIKQRVKAAEKQIRTFDPKSINSAEVQKKLNHNHRLFFDQGRVYDQITDRLIRPMLEFIESRP